MDIDEEIVGFFLGRFSAKLGPSRLKGSSCSTGWNNKQPGRPILRRSFGAKNSGPLIAFRYSEEVVCGKLSVSEQRRNKLRNVWIRKVPVCCLGLFSIS